MQIPALTLSPMKACTALYSASPTRFVSSNWRPKAYTARSAGVAGNVSSARTAAAGLLSCAALSSSAEIPTRRVVTDRTASIGFQPVTAVHPSYLQICTIHTSATASRTVLHREWSVCKPLELTGPLGSNLHASGAAICHLHELP